MRARTGTEFQEVSRRDHTRFCCMLRSALRFVRSAASDSSWLFSTLCCAGGWSLIQPSTRSLTLSSSLSIDCLPPPG